MLMIFVAEESREEAEDTEEAEDIKEAEKEKQERVREEIKEQEEREESRGREESREGVQVKDKERAEGRKESENCIPVVVCLSFLKNSVHYMTLLAHTYLKIVSFRVLSLITVFLLKFRHL